LVGVQAVDFVADAAEVEVARLGVVGHGAAKLWDARAVVQAVLRMELDEAVVPQKDELAIVFREHLKGHG